MARDCPKNKKNFPNRKYNEPKKEEPKKKWNLKDAHCFICGMSTQE